VERIIKKAEARMQRQYVFQQQGKKHVFDLIFSAKLQGLLLVL